MPNPKKKNNAPKGAYTDTNTDAPKMMMKKQKKAIADSAVGGASTGGAAQMTRKATPIAKSGNTSGGRAGSNPGQLSNRRTATPLANDALSGAAAGGVIGYRKATPASGGGGGRVSSDPFLRGFNDENPSIEGGHYRNRRRHS